MSESALQKAVTTYLSGLERLYKNFVFFHVPNGGQRSKRYARFLQTQGARAGVPDLIFFADGKAFAIELKYKSTLSEAQKLFHERLKFQNIPVYTVKAKTPSEAVSFVEQILIKHGLIQYSEHAEKEKVPA